MKRIFLALCLAIAPIGLTSCATSPATQTAEVKTLLVVGASAKAGLDACTQLLKAGKMSVADYQKVAAFFDGKFQPAFRLAVAVAKSDTAPASPDLLSLAAQFASLVATYTNHP